MRSRWAKVGWVVGAVIPVGVTLSFVDGDRLLALLTLFAALAYVSGRRMARH